MSVMQSTYNLTPPSALRTRPIGDETAKPGKEPVVSTETVPVAQRASRQHPKHTDAAEEINEWQQVDTGNTRHDRATGVPRQASTASKKLPKVPGSKATRSRGKFWQRAHPLFYLGIGMIAMLALWILLSTTVSWWNTTWDDIHYGRPRTFQINAFVGHNEAGGTPSHFIAINLNGRIEVIELPGGDGSKSRIYLGPQLYGSGDDLIPVTISFVDVNGDHRPDMLIHFQSSPIVFINYERGFRQVPPYS